MNAYKRNFCIIVTVCLVLFCAYMFFRHHGGRDFEQLLAGDPGINVVLVTIVGQGRRIEIADKVALTYLSSAFRAAKNQGYVRTHFGYSYHADVKLNTGRSVSVGCSADDDVDGLTIGYPNNSLGDPVMFWVPLPDPIPRAISVVLREMRKPPERSSGDTILFTQMTQSAVVIRRSGTLYLFPSGRSELSNPLSRDSFVLD